MLAEEVCSAAAEDFSLSSLIAAIRSEISADASRCFCVEWVIAWLTSTMPETAVVMVLRVVPVPAVCSTVSLARSRPANVAPTASVAPVCSRSIIARISTVDS